ncbi:hypothetical protein BC940DRAFT_72967, partial [Gongronella butleri]
WTRFCLVGSTHTTRPSPQPHFAQGIKDTSRRNSVFFFSSSNSSHTYTMEKPQAPPPQQQYAAPGYSPAPQQGYAQAQPQYPQGGEKGYPQGQPIPGGDPYLNEARVHQLQQEIEANSCDICDICLYIWLGPFALFCVMPKWNKKNKAETELKIELTKPRRQM